MTKVFEGIGFFLTSTLEWLKNHEEEKRTEDTNYIISNCVSYTYVGLGP